MNTPEDRYKTDPAYRTLVDLIESQLERAQFSPSEVRECAVMACIHYEMRQAHAPMMPQRVRGALEELKRYREGKQ